MAPKNHLPPLFLKIGGQNLLVDAEPRVSLGSQLRTQKAKGNAEERRLKAKGHTSRGFKPRDK